MDVHLGLVGPSQPGSQRAPASSALVVHVLQALSKVWQESEANGEAERRRHSAVGDNTKTFVSITALHSLQPLWRPHALFAVSVSSLISSTRK